MRRQLAGGVVLGLLLSGALLVSPRGSSGARLGLHVNADEVALWKQRMTDTTTGSNGVTFQAIYEARILPDANAFRSQSHPGGDGQWRGWTGGGCAPGAKAAVPRAGPGRTPYGRGNGAWLTRAAFVFLLTGDRSYADPVRTELLQQAAQPGTDWANTKRWCVNELGSQNTIETIPWLYRLLLAYDYLEAGGYTGFSAAERATLAAWFRSAATLWDQGHRQGVRNGTWKGMYDAQQRLTCTGSLCTAPGPLLYLGGPAIRQAHNAFNNVGTMAPLLSTAVGLKFGDAAQLQSAKAWFSAFLQLGLWDNGAMQDFTRWRDCAPSCPGSMWTHAGGVWGPVTAAADMLARTGDASLYTSKWQTALQLAAEMANKTTRLYGTTNAAARGPATLLSWDTGTPDKGQYYDFAAMVANVFYQNPTIATAMARPLRARNSNQSPAGCYDDQFGGCFSGVWAFWPDLPFMYGQRSGDVTPYEGETTRPPLDGPPRRAPRNLRVLN